MKFFSNILESQNKEIILTPDELKMYIEKVGKKMPQDIQNILSYVLKYNILSSTDLLEFENISKSRINGLAEKFNMSIQEAEDLSKLFSGLGVAKKQLPHFQSKKEFNNILAGKKELEDMSLDLTTEKGRTATLKQYMPLIHKIVNQYAIKNPTISKEELFSSALEGFTLAMNDYHSSDDNYIDDGGEDIDRAEAIKQKGQSFKQYASWRMKYKICDYLNDLSRTVRISRGQIKKNNETDPSANFNSQSIDLMMSDDPDVVSQADRMKELSEKPTAAKPNEEKSWKQIFAIIDQKFNVKQASIFYKVFGLNGFEKMTGVEVAKELGCTKQYISKVVKQITTFLRDDRRTSELLQELQDMYTESLIINNFGKKDITLLEAFAQDDIYMLLTEMNKWSSPNALKSNIDMVLEDYDRVSKKFIIDCLNQGFEYLDSNYRKNKKLIVHFLSGMYPTESLTKKSDVYILELMEELINIYKNNKIIL